MSGDAVVVLRRLALVMGIGSLVIGAVVLYGHPFTPRNLGFLSATVVALLSYRELAAGRVNRALVVMFWGFLAGCLVTATLAAGLRTPVLIALPFLQITIAWVQGRRAVVAMTMAILVYLVAMVAAEHLGWLPEPVPRSSLAYMVVYGVTCVGAGVMALAMADGFRRQLASANALADAMALKESERAQTQTALQESERRFRSMIEWAPEPIMVHRADKLLYVNSAAVAALGAISAQELLARSISELMLPDFLDRAVAHLQATLEVGVSTPMYEVRCARLDGRVIDVQVHSIGLLYDGELAVQTLFQDISDRKAAANQIEQLAFFDPLTGLPNRRLMRDRLEQALVASARNQQWGALLLFDLDNFKTLNDTMGHSVGDELLQEVARRLRSDIRQGDTVARLGGDEFVVILSEVGDSTHAQQHVDGTTRKMLNQLLAPFGLATDPYDPGGGKRNYQCTASVGIAMFLGRSVGGDELMKRADTAMYQAKASGRNALKFFDPTMQAVVNQRAEMEHDLRRALVERQFELHCQPQLSHAGEVTGGEVLLRWPHPANGMIAPAHFIPLAEESGIILPLGHWVLETACTRLASWALRPDMAHLTIAVNVSARQFNQGDFVEQVQAVLVATGANPNRLKLELTESALLQDVQGVIQKMLHLKAKGVGFSLDDFGTGYSSLSYLKRLPIDQLKIDKSFVSEVLTDPSTAAIVKSIIALGQNLGLDVIAEGVETPEQTQFLADAGCRSFQGYHFGRPMPLGDFEQFVLR